jgi:hypothetical protein
MSKQVMSFKSHTGAVFLFLKNRFVQRKPHVLHKPTIASIMWHFLKPFKLQ